MRYKLATINQSIEAVISNPDVFRRGEKSVMHGAVPAQISRLGKQARNDNV